MILLMNDHQHADCWRHIEARPEDKTIYTLHIVFQFVFAKGYIIQTNRDTQV